jgi:D-beta-D-heptose 7-phosphate kinase/D-beta-D-heptose 1-phosphate adenosyltransferase
MKFLVVGDQMVDRYWRGQVVRLNPEKHSAPLLNYRDIVDRPGGAANVAANVEAMGAEVVLVSQRAGAIVKNRLLDEHDGVVARFDQDNECQPISPNKIVEAADGCCAVIVSDYGKGAINQAVADQVKLLDLPTFVDTKMRPDRWVEWTECLFPNEREFLLHKSDYQKARQVVMKCGARGAKVIQRGMQLDGMVAPNVKCVRNVAGAGDTVVAAYVASYMALGLTKPPEYRTKFSLRLAMDFAGAAVAEPLTAAPTFADVYGPCTWGEQVEWIAAELRK